MARYNDKGEEIPDTTPVAVPLRFRRTPEDDLHDRIRAILRSQVFSERAHELGVESPEEADDFEVDDAEEADLPIAAAEKAYLMAEELRAAAGDLQELEGKVRQGPGSAPEAPKGKEGKEASPGVRAPGDEEEPA